jgi:hypothetical protein
MRTMTHAGTGRTVRGVAAIFVVAVGLALSGGCSTPNGLKVSAESTFIAVGQSTKLTATGFQSKGCEGPTQVPVAASWSIAPGGTGAGTINGSTFTATKPGEIVLKAAWRGFEQNVPMTIRPADGSQAGGEVAPSVDTPEPADPATLERIFLSGNDGGVSNGGKPVSFTTTEPRRIRELWTYHWNDQKGSTGGGTITLKRADGTEFGAYAVTRTPPGQGGVPNAYWVADVDFELPAGTYTIYDSDPSTWAQNSLTNGLGHAWVMAERR